MKIGILTFHWATNYGAIMQCYALQTYLEQLGHTVFVIDYKPKQYDDSLCTFFRLRKFLHFNEYMENKRKEFALKKFRIAKLKLSHRFSSFRELSDDTIGCDVIISGSDQVLNPFFLMNGEGLGHISPTYFLGFPFKGKKIAYAVSFGCVEYPSQVVSIASKYIRDFDSISVREKTGVNIIESFGRDDAVLVPDPTLLMESEFYHQQANEIHTVYTSPYIYSFFIRNIYKRKLAINSCIHDKIILWNNEDGNYSMQGWLSKIKYAEYVITDSFHCVVMCLKLHKPFIVIVEEKGNVGMNDRLYSLLEPLNLSKYILYKDNVDVMESLMMDDFDWGFIDEELESLMLKGQTFLNCI